MSMAFVEGQVDTNGSGVATTPAFTNTFALGQLVIVAIAYSNTTNVTTSVVDNASTSNTYTLIPGASKTNTLLYLALYYAVITHSKASPTVTVNFNSASANATVAVQYFNGFVGTPTLDQSTSSANTTSTTLTSGASSATTQATELVIGAGSYSSTATTFTLGSGYTNLTPDNVSGGSIALESKLVASTGAQTAMFTLGATRVNTGGVITFYDNAGGGVNKGAMFLPMMGA